MSLDTRPAVLEASGTPNHMADFQVTRASEVTGLLRQLRDSGAPVILSTPDGTAYASTLWSYDAQANRLSFSADEQHVQVPRLVNADEAVAVAYLDNVKLQFDIQRLMLVRGAQTCALQTEFPKIIYRFQRRNSFRVRTLDSAGPTASFRHPSIPDMALALRVVDVSIGGCALLLPQDVPPVQAGTRLPSVHVDLDADTRFNAGIMLHHISSQFNGSGHRLGCEWLQMDGAAQRGLQRFIDHTQKRRRMLALP